MKQILSCIHVCFKNMFILLPVSKTDAPGKCAFVYSLASSVPSMVGHGQLVVLKIEWVETGIKEYIEQKILCIS